jgi:hypothetical protein
MQFAAVPRTCGNEHSAVVFPLLTLDLTVLCRDTGPHCGELDTTCREAGLCCMKAARRKEEVSIRDRRFLSELRVLERIWFAIEWSDLS